MVYAVTRLLLVSLVVMVGACGPSGPRYVSDPQRLRGLPDDPRKLVSLADTLTAADGLSPRRTDRALAALEKALRRGHPKPYEVHWRTARACFLMTEQLPNTHQKLGYARVGRNAARRAVAIDKQRVEGYYYLALTTAKVAEAENSMSLIKPMLRLGEKAAALDKSYDSAGPLRFLGKIYLTAPAWPVSVGSPGKAVELLERAVQIAPEPLNMLFLGEAYYHDEEYEDAARLIRQALVQGKAAGMHDRWQREGERYLRKACSKADSPACSALLPARAAPRQPTALVGENAPQPERRPALGERL